jgi:Xaa-Pro aminopeptidase
MRQEDSFGETRRRLLKGLAACGFTPGLARTAGATGMAARRVAPPATPAVGPFAGPPISVRSFEARLRRIRNEMSGRGLDCLLVASVLNHAVRYLGFFDPDLQGRASGGPQLALALLPLEGEPAIFLQTFTSADYLLPRARAASLIEDLRLVGGGHEKLLEAVAGELRARKLASAKLGLAGGELEWAMGLFLARELPRARAENANLLLDRLRMVKDPEEMTLLRRSAAIGDAGIRAVQRVVRPGRSDFDLAAEAESEMRRLGADEDTFVLMGMGPSANPMLMEGLSGRRVPPDGVVVFEVLPYYRHYNTELAVTFSVGRVNARQRAAASACEAAYRAGLEQVKPGAPAGRLVGAAIEAFHAHGFDAFTHSIGHFLGLDNYEGLPLRDPELVFQPGMVFSFHPNVVVSGLVKEQVCGLLSVTDKGFESLSEIEVVGLRGAA